MSIRRLIASLAATGAIVAAGIAGAPSALAATAWWVDNTAANCSNTGPGTAVTPFCTISAAATRAVTAGDVVTVRPGNYPEQITVAASGGSGAPITFTTSGPGVVVVGTRDLSTVSWTDAGGGTWSTPYAPPSSPKQVFVDGARLATGTSASGLSANQFFYDTAAKVLYVNLGGQAVSGRAILAGAQTYGFNIVGRTSIVVAGFTTSGQNSAGVRVSGSSAVTVDQVSAVDAGVNGVLVESTSSAVTVSRSTVTRSASIGIRFSSTTASRITGNVVTRSGNHGIALSGAPGTTVDGNESADNRVVSGTATAAGIDVNSSSTDAVVRGNLVHGNQDSGIQVYGGSNRALLVRNISYANGDHGIDALGSVGVTFVSNTVHGNFRDGISLEGNATGASLRNNVVVDNGLTTGSNNLYVEQASLSGLSADRDILWNSAWAPSVRVGLTRYQTVADFRAATGYEATGLGVDPHFVAPGSGDFRLSANSAAIDSADASVSGFAMADRTGALPADDPNVPDTGAGTPAYADRGALERGPQADDPAENPPYAALVLSTTVGQVPPGVPVTADASGSSDADAHGIASYTFDFGDGTVVGPQSSGKTSHTYQTSGVFDVTVTVRDTSDRSATATRTVTLGDRPLVTYRVDRGAASCSDNADGVTTPFCTIGKAAAVALAGDTVVVEPGDYPEQVTPANTGMSGAPLTFTAHGAGVRLIGTTDLSSTALWTSTSTAAWRATVSSASPVSQVFLDGTRLTKAASATATTTNSFFYDAAAAMLYVDVGGPNPGTVGGIQASTRTYGFKIWNADTVVISGFTSWGANSAGFSIQDSTGVSITGATALFASSYGISADRSSDILVASSTSANNGSIGIRMNTVSRPTVRSSQSHHNGYHGISLQTSADGVVSGNVTYSNVHPLQRLGAGIDVSLNSTGALVERNTSYGNQDSGIEIYPGSTGALVRRNISYDNGDHGVDVLSATNTRVIGNTIVGNNTAGINLEGGSSGSMVGNNVSVDNAVTSTRTIGDIRVDEASAPGSSVDWNLVYRSDGGPLYEWNSQPYATVESFQAVSGLGAHDIARAPRFVDMTARNLALTVSSPAIDGANQGMSGAAAQDHDGIDPVDVESVPNTGAGSPAFTDRGALEFHGADTRVGPTAALSVAPSTGAAPLAVAASATGSTPGSAPIDSYTFDCGNGTTVGPQSEASASCTYSSAGNFTVGVLVTDANGLTSTATAPVTVTVASNAPPTASLSVATPPGLTAPTAAGLDASGSTDPEGGPLTYAFDCGNGTTVGPQGVPTATCNYPAAGTFAAKVAVTDDHGQTATSSPVTFTIAANQAPTASLNVTLSSSRAPATAALDATGSSDPEGGPLRYTYACGNGVVVGPTSSITASCQYASQGKYQIRLTVTDAAGLTANKVVNIRLT